MPKSIRDGEQQSNSAARQYMYIITVPCWTIHSNDVMMTGDTLAGAHLHLIKVAKIKKPNQNTI